MQHQRQKEQQLDIPMQTHHERSTDQTSVIVPLKLPKFNEQKSKNTVLPKYDAANDSDNSDEDDNAIAEVHFLFSFVLSYILVLMKLFLKVLSSDIKEALIGIEAFNKVLFAWVPTIVPESSIAVYPGTNSRPLGTFQPFIDKLLTQVRSILDDIGDLSNIYRKVNSHTYSYQNQ